MREISLFLGSNDANKGTRKDTSLWDSASVCPKPGSVELDREALAALRMDGLRGALRVHVFNQRGEAQSFVAGLRLSPGQVSVRLERAPCDGWVCLFQVPDHDFDVSLHDHRAEIGEVQNDPFPLAPVYPEPLPATWISDPTKGKRERSFSRPEGIAISPLPQILAHEVMRSHGKDTAKATIAALQEMVGVRSLCDVTMSDLYEAERGLIIQTLADVLYDGRLDDAQSAIVSDSAIVARVSRAVARSLSASKGELDEKLSREARVIIGSKLAEILSDELSILSHKPPSAAIKPN